LHSAVTREAIELVHFPKFFHQRWRRYTVAYFPAGAVISFAERKAHKASFQQFRITQHAFMLLSIKHKVLVHLIAQYKNLGIFYNFF